MKFLSKLLKRRPRASDWIVMSREAALKGAVAIVATAASFSAVILAPFLDSLEGVVPKAVAVLLGMGGLYLVFQIADRAFARIRFGHFVGEWLYITTNDSCGRGGKLGKVGPRRFGFLRIQPGPAGDLAIHITGFTDGGAMRRFADGDSPPELSTGQGSSLAARYDDADGVIHLVYQLRFNDRRESREGKMRLAVQSSRGLSGRWVSTGDKELREGQLVARRLREAPKDDAAWHALIDGPAKSG